MKTAFKSTLRHDSLITSKNPSLPMIALGGAMPPATCTVPLKPAANHNTLCLTESTPKTGAELRDRRNTPAATGVVRDLQG